MKTGIPTIGHPVVDDQGFLRRDPNEITPIMRFLSEPPVRVRVRNKFVIRTAEQHRKVDDFIKSLGFDKL